MMCGFRLEAPLLRPLCFLFCLLLLSSCSGEVDQGTPVEETPAATAPLLTVSPDTLDFGSVILNQTATLTLTLTNTGQEPLTLATLSLEDDTRAFALLDALASAPLEPGADISTELTFSPTTETDFEASLLVTLEGHTDPTQTLLLTGEGSRGTDADGDGITAEEGDCDDGNNTVYPDALEICDDLDNNCDGQVDEDIDKDSDGTSDCIDDDGDGSREADGDCDDGDDTIYPGAQETCNGLDDDCNFQTDEGILTDADGDGQPLCGEDCDDGDPSIYAGAEEQCNGQDDNCDQVIDEGFDQDGDGVTQCDVPWPDCDDSRPDVNHNAIEVCDGSGGTPVDEDCDGLIDEGFDQDGDGTADCTDDDLDGLSEDDGDCDDLNSAVSPELEEVCDGLDNTCDGMVDEGFDADLIGGADCTDDDGDGVSEDAGDCDDEDPSQYPEAPELCNLKDDNCNGAVDEDASLDGDGDGVTACGGDCDDGDASVHPDGLEVCDGRDQDCDGVIDDGLEIFPWFQDQDGDGFGSVNQLESCAQPNGYVPEAGDCDDQDVTIHPEAEEVCNTIDDNCDGQVDEGFDQDQDGFSLCDPSSPDCDDGDPSIRPESTEICDGQDNNCDGQVDEGFDLDGIAGSDCVDQDLDGYTEQEGDCDDGDPTRFPNALELCNAVDDDCDGRVDESSDLDGDSTDDCIDDDGDGLNELDGDCDDSQATTYPGADEICNGIDDSCDGEADEGLTQVVYYLDADRDGFGGGEETIACLTPEGYVANDDDCDDGDPSVNPAAEEQCNEVDDDCDGSIDDGLTELTSYEDLDQDGFGNSDVQVQDCLVPQGFVTEGGDCDDSDAAIYPEAEEGVGDEIDQNCDGRELCYLDADADGFRDDVEVLYSLDEDCQDGVEATADLPGGDCDDGDPAVNPDAQELCNEVDDDCDGVLDDGVTGFTFHLDLDGDGYGDADVPLEACTQPQGYVFDDTDCNDQDGDIYPGAEETVGDEVDYDCDGTELCYVDLDGDGVRGDNGEETIASSDLDCSDAGETLASAPVGDCDDTDAAIYPEASEQCNDVDDNCDGRIDEGNVCASGRDRDVDHDDFHPVRDRPLIDGGHPGRGYNDVHGRRDDLGANGGLNGDWR